MEFTREYDSWKNKLAGELAGVRKSAEVVRLIDRLWYEAAFEVIRKGDVYNPSGSRFIPKVYLVDATTAVQLRTMSVGDSFRVNGSTEKYEVLIAGQQKVWSRTVEGIMVEFDGDLEVLRESDLTRGPDGNTESRVAIATFPVAHVVAHRTVSVQKSPYWCTFPIGDGQASPHFMRYSGLTGAAINTMLINNYISASMDRDKVFASKERILNVSRGTNWSNDEVITRGTGANYGSDGFLRPGFKYDKMIEYLYFKTVEMDTSGYKGGIEDGIEDGTVDEDEKVVDLMFQKAWLKKFASALVPRGMEFQHSFITTLQRCLGQTIMKRLDIEMREDEELESESKLLQSFQEYSDNYGENVGDVDEEHGGDLLFKIETQWEKDISQIFESSNTSAHVKEIVRSKYLSRAYRIAKVIHKSYKVAREDAMERKRISSEAENQPKSADALATEFAVEAQAFANGLAMSALLATTSLALNLFQARVATFFGAFLALNNISGK